MTKKHRFKWVDKSVLLYSSDRDPIEKIEAQAKKVVLDALEKGWNGPPYDPIKLAEIMRINVSPNADIRDAQTVTQPNGRYLIQFNPNKSRGRIRFSIAHEIAHTFFPDCADEVRERHKTNNDNNKWQLEMLCNIAASEIVMPIGSMPEILDQDISISEALELRKKLDVSTEALLIRLVKLTNNPITVFCASKIEKGIDANRHQIDYSIHSKAWPYPSLNGHIVDSEALNECTAIGYKVENSEIWNDNKIDIECVGLPPYPGSNFPRIVGILKCSIKKSTKRLCISYHEGDATKPGGKGKKIIAHIVNDKTPNWGGGGFAVSLKREYPEVQNDFKNWVFQDRGNLSIGKYHISKLSENLSVFSIVAQRGYGKSSSPRIRYQALENGLNELGKYAINTGASVHMPRIGTGSRYLQVRNTDSA